MTHVTQDDRISPYAIWFLRVTLGIALLTHVALNLGGLGPDGARGLGLPLGVPVLGLVFELAVALALIFGIWPRALAMGGAAVVLGVTVKVGGPAAFTCPLFAWAGPALWIGAFILLSLLGDGPFVLLPTGGARQ